MKSGLDEAWVMCSVGSYVVLGHMWCWAICSVRSYVVLGHM
jgi:hypothetical protein